MYFAEYQILDWHFPAFSTVKVCVHCLLFESAVSRWKSSCYFLWGGGWLQVWTFSCWQLKLLLLSFCPTSGSADERAWVLPPLLLVGDPPTQACMGIPDPGPISQSQGKPGQSLLLALSSHPCSPPHGYKHVNSRLFHSLWYGWHLHSWCWNQTLGGSPVTFAGNHDTFILF